jgi:hypothetical protein
MHNMSSSKAILNYYLKFQFLYQLKKNIYKILNFEQPTAIYYFNIIFSKTNLI